MTRFKMQKIGVEQFAILTNTKPIGTITLKSDFETKVAADSPIVTISLRVNLLTDDTTVLETLFMKCEFAIHPDDYAALKDNNKTIFSASLLSHMALHVVGTARGVLYCKNEGSVFADMILPPINVAEIFNEDIVVE